MSSCAVCGAHRDEECVIIGGIVHARVDTAPTKKRRKSKPAVSVLHSLTPSPMLASDLTVSDQVRLNLRFLKTPEGFMAALRAYTTHPTYNKMNDVWVNDAVTRWVHGDAVWEEKDVTDQLRAELTPILQAEIAAWVEEALRTT